MPRAALGSLTPDLAALQVEIEAWARGCGLDFYPTIFELLDADQLHAIAARGGFPVRYPHWRFGMEYEQLHKGYRYGLQKIYEMVINNDPCYAYLMRCNERIDQKLVMAHVYGHADFFKNNAWFAPTDRKMMDQMANHGARVRRYIDEVGRDEVEEFIDVCLSLEDLIDVHAPFIRRRESPPTDSLAASLAPAAGAPARFPAKRYMDPFVNPRRPDVRATVAAPPSRAFPDRPERDVLLFLLEHAPLDAWQADVLAIVRDEAYYFAPQAQTKIMNEGWASYWHSSIMIRHAVTDAEVVNYCDRHSGTLAAAPGQLNPYKVGLELFRDIEDRWNRGAFGPEYDQCEDETRRRRRDVGAGLGRRKIFEVRRIHNDLTFIDEFLTLDFVRDHKLFRFGYNPGSQAYEIESREFPQVKRQLLANLTNRGRPLISVADGNFRNRGELYLRHDYEGTELQVDAARDTLVNLQRIWGRPVHVATTLQGSPVLLSFDGSRHDRSARTGSPADAAAPAQE